ncbi:Gamma-tubulin complex component 3 [Nosema bombycis CQ1]|uniref:Gamma-tubulin complex component 3 n=1 Tax=Nosema bombycis (strain CQ1 / CVCC 102059) TaxID=578461 RepID=R0MIN1_NOSB1|nr:Gamma-tubulin complex component 3 [Nosema bombycis CQ1]|eukprot:EOB14030.1 Gamma-tubulin complex component 3 [Nosema bombycis CQ1]
MKKLIRSLVENIFKNKRSPSESFIDSLIPKFNGNTILDEEFVSICCKQKSYEVFLIYKNLKKNNTIIKLVYVLLKLSSKTTPLIIELTNNIKKASLGFKVSHFEDTKIALLRGRIENHLFEIVFQIYQHGCIYKNLKVGGGSGGNDGNNQASNHFNNQASNLNEPSNYNNNNNNNPNHSTSISMQFFCEIVRNELKIYENQVLSQEDDLLSFYVGMYSSYLKLKILHQIYECFKDNFCKPFEFLKMNFSTSQPFTRNIIEASARHLNNCLRSFVKSGSFEDEFNEFFIKQKNESIWDNYVIIEENIPYFINKEIVENILYIGKCIGLLKWICNNEGLIEIQCICEKCNKNRDFKEGNGDNDNGGSNNGHNLTHNPNINNSVVVCFKDILLDFYNISLSLDILNKDLSSIINQLLILINLIIDEAFIKKFSLLNYLEGIKNIFLCGRSDFLETLFLQLKKIKKLTKRSYNYVLDSSLENTVGYKNEFYLTLDVFLHESSNSYDNFTLFSNIPFPLSIVITKEIVFDLSKIFKFLWIIKRNEHLLRKVKDGEKNKAHNDSGNQNMDNNNMITRIKIITYSNLINKFYFYLFEELIEINFSKIFKTKKRKILDLQMNLQLTIRNILKKMYIDYESKLFYRFIKQLEEKLMDKISGNKEFDDDEIKAMLKNNNLESFI